MKKVLSLTLIFVLCFSLLAGCSQKADAKKPLTLFTWEGMFPQELLDGFTKETGYPINYVNFDFDETMLSKLEAAKGGDYDLVIADDYIIETAIEKGLVQKIDYSKLSNKENINPIYQSQFFDKTNEYTVPYSAGVLALAYNPNEITKPITSYEDLWDISLKDSIGIVENPRVINGMALKIMGESYNTEDIDVINEAGKKLLELAPNIRLIKNDNIQDDLISGEVNATLMYTSQVTAAKLTNPEIEVVFPKEGLGFGIMAEFIPVNAPNPEAAHAFINYLLNAENAAKGYEHLGYYSTNLKADELIADEYKSFLTLPKEFDGSKMEMVENVNADAEAAHAKVWTEFKAACGK